MLPKKSRSSAKATANRDSTLAVMTQRVIFHRMERLAAFFIFCLAFAVLPAASPLLTLENAQLPSPASVGAYTPQFVNAANGHILLSWIQPGPDNSPALHFAQFDPPTHAWSEPILAGPTNSTPPSAQLVSNRPPITVCNGGRIATAWFVADQRDPRVLLSVSPDGGSHFLMPLHVEDTRPIGAPDLVLLADGTVFVSWPEHADKDETALWLRRISPGGELSVPVLLATLPTDHAVPRLAVVKDYDATSAQLLLAYSLGDGEASQIVTRLLTISLPTNAPAKPCNCPGDSAARGYALKGRVISLNITNETLVVQHDEIPGVLPAATTAFKTDPSLLKFAATGNEVYARIEQREGQWWLFGARLIIRP